MLTLMVFEKSRIFKLQINDIYNNGLFCSGI